MLGMLDNGIRMNPAFVAKVHEKRRAARIAETNERRMERLRTEIAEKQLAMAVSAAMRLSNAHEEFVEHEPIPLKKAAERQLAKDIIRRFAVQNGVSYETIIGHRRGKELVALRHRCIRIVADAYPQMSLPWIGKQFGGRDHTTIISSLKKTKRPGELR